MTITYESMQSGKKLKPPRLVVYGPEKIGKSSFAASAPAPVFIDIEGGLDNLDVKSWRAKTLDDVKGVAHFLRTEDHDRKTVVLDSLDWLEPLIWNEVIQNNPISSKGKVIKDITDYGYNEGYRKAMVVWADLLKMFDDLRDERNMSIIFLAHHENKTFNHPEKGSFHYFSPKLHSFACDKMVEWAEGVFFANNQIVISTEQGTFGGPDKKKVIGEGSRVVHTQKRNSLIAGQRFTPPIPDEISIPKDDITWNALWSILATTPYYQALKKGEITAPTPADKLPA